jgi:hypothetical protein
MQEGSAKIVLDAEFFRQRSPGISSQRNQVIVVWCDYCFGA